MKPIRAALLVATVSLAGCQSLADGARETFSKEHTCPLDRVDVRERPELLASSFRLRAKPPADIAADPGRLQMWRDKEEARRTSSDGMGSIAEARGCGKQGFYRCYRSQKHASQMTCFEQGDETGTIPKW